MKEFGKIAGGMVAILIALTVIIPACKKDTDGSNTSSASSGMKATAVDPVQGAAGSTLTVTGDGLGGIATILFDNGNVPASFNPTFNTSGALLFRVPDTANGGDQNIIITNNLGKSVSIPFKVIALQPLQEPPEAILRPVRRLPSQVITWMT